MKEASREIAKQSSKQVCYSEDLALLSNLCGIAKLDLKMDKLRPLYPNEFVIIRYALDVPNFEMHYLDHDSYAPSQQTLTDLLTDREIVSLSKKVYKLLLNFFAEEPHK